MLDAVKTFTVGALPDMLTFSPDGSKVLVANEGEAVVEVADDGTMTITDPEGSVSIIDVSGEFSALTTADGQTIKLGGFSGLYYDGVADNGNLKFRRGSSDSNTFDWELKPQSLVK